VRTGQQAYLNHVLAIILRLTYHKTKRRKLTYEFCCPSFDGFMMPVWVLVLRFGIRKYFLLILNVCRVPHGR
jgi:hypothetical protein